MNQAAEDFQLEELVVGANYVRPRLSELTALAQRLDDARVAFKEATDAVADKAQIAPGALRTYVMAQIKDDPSKVIDKKNEEFSDFCQLVDEIGA